MNLFELFVKIGVDDQASEKTENLKEKLGNGLKTAAKVGTAAVTAASAAVVALTKQSIESYAEYEQLVGGVETLYGKTQLTFEEFSEEMRKKGVTDVLEIGAAYQKTFEDARTVIKNADAAYKNAGMSSNEYLSTVTSFSASLLQSLEGDTKKAAEYADLAITDMSDNANKMGSDIEVLKTAYAGFAKGQFMLLDNLKLGYGGTKEEMARLLEDAQKISGIKYDISSYADIVQAIHVIQDEMGIYGATTEEAATTIEGSLKMTKASWENLLTGMADDEADFESLIGRFVESAGIAAENILPRIQVALNGASDLIKNLFPVLAEQIPAIIEQNVPALAEAAIAIIQALIVGISQNEGMLMETAINTIAFLASSLIEQLPQIVQLGFDLIFSLAQGIAENLPELMPTIISVILHIVEILTDQENLVMLLDAALQIIVELGYGLMDAIPALVSAVYEVVFALADFLIDPENLAMIISAAFQIVVALGTGLVKNTPNLIRSAGELIASLVEQFKSTDWVQIGRDLVAGFKRGIQEAWKNLREWFTSLFGDLKAIAKRILGIASPSKVFKQFGKFVDEGLAIGIRDNADVAYSAVSDLAKGVSNGFDVSLGTNYIGTYKTTSSSGYFNSPISKTDSLLTELISMFRNGTATTNVGNTRELRRAVNA